MIRHVGVMTRFRPNPLISSIGLILCDDFYVSVSSRKIAHVSYHCPSIKNQYEISEWYANDSAQFGPDRISCVDSAEAPNRLESLLALCTKGAEALHEAGLPTRPCGHVTGLPMRPCDARHVHPVAFNQKPPGRKGYCWFYRWGELCWHLCEMLTWRPQTNAVTLLKMYGHSLVICVVVCAINVSTSE